MTTKTGENNITSAEYQMLVRRCDFIDTHKEITTEHLPDELIELWSVKDFTTNRLCNAEDAQMLVFMHILKTLVFSKQEQKQFFGSFDFLLCFYHFQIILAAVAYSRKSHIPIAPFPIAPFPIFDAKRYIVPHLNRSGVLMRQYEIVTRENMG